MLVIRRLFGTGTNCIAPSGLPLLLCLFPGLAPWAFLSRPCGASFAPETSQYRHGRTEVVPQLYSGPAHRRGLTAQEALSPAEDRSGAGLRIPSFFIRASSVVGFRPRSTAAPPFPLTFQQVCSRAFRMCSRSRSSKVVIRELGRLNASGFGSHSPASS